MSPETRPLLSPPTLDRRRLLQAAGACAGTSLIGVTSAPAEAAVEIELEAGPTLLEIDGRPVELLTYNGLFPGPLVRAREGELLRVGLTNRLDEPTNLHFHGLHVSPGGGSDNVFVEVAPGERFVYELRVPEGYGGTFWYHPHRHHRLARQLWRGLAGPLVIDRPVDRQAGLAEADEHVLVVKDLTVEDGRPAPHTTGDWARGKSGRLVFVNGAIRPDLAAGRRAVRLRLINACNGRSLLLARKDGRPLTALGRDGHLFPRAETADEMLLVPAQRLDLLIEMAGAAPVELLHLPYSRGARREPPSAETLFALHPPDTPDGPVRPVRLDGIERLDAADATHRRRFRMAMAFLSADGQHHMSPLKAKLGALELWEITNVDTQDHVFHLHTWPFQVWRQDGQAPPFPAWRDTVNLRPGETVELLVPFRHFTGKSVFHCHIAEHGDAGMMGIVEVEA